MGFLAVVGRWLVTRGGQGMSCGRVQKRCSPPISQVFDRSKMVVFVRGGEGSSGVIFREVTPHKNWVWKTWGVILGYFLSFPPRDLCTFFSLSRETGYEDRVELILFEKIRGGG